MDTIMILSIFIIFIQVNPFSPSYIEIEQEDGKKEKYSIINLVHSANFSHLNALEQN
ncbi:MAG: hypothetical protein ABI597_13455 [Gammaproteobacteria bacterium]